jgi:curli biogenesis system outer membrane secretion channel CsgG
VDAGRLFEGKSLTRTIRAIVVAGMLLGPAAQAALGAPPQAVDAAAALRQLTPKPLAKRAAVAIYTFRSEVQEVGARGATDMFITALTASGQFRVVERARLADGVAREKQLNGAGMTSGNTAQRRLRGAQYVFEGAVTEANVAENSSQHGLNIGGMTFGGGSSRDSIAVDVRILDADSGDVLDAVNVSLPINSSNSSVSGTAALVGTIASMTGHSVNPLTPDLSTQSSQRDGVDKVVRAAIDSAVLQLIQRLNLSVDSSTQ